MKTRTRSWIETLFLLLGVCALSCVAHAENAIPQATENSPVYASASAAPPARDTTDDTNHGDGRPEPERVRFGVLGGVGFPRPLAIEAMVKFGKLLGVGIEYSRLPSLTISGVDTSFWAIAGDLRFFPSRSPFFLGLRMGRQHLGGSTVIVTQYGDIPANATLDTTFINPRVGFLWTWKPGITLGIDAGIQIPISNHLATSLPIDVNADQTLLSEADRRIIDVAKTFGKSVIPTVDLLRIGFLL